MEKINWKLRFRNKTWVTGLISQTLLLVQGIILALASIGVIDINIEHMGAWVAAITVIVNLILAYFAYLGIVVDPTVEGVGDSAKALDREEPLSAAQKKNKYNNL